MKPTKLKQIALWCGGELDPQYHEVEVAGVSTDSREVKPGQLFVPLAGAPGGRPQFYPPRHGERRGRGIEREAPAPSGIPMIQVEDTLLAFGAIAAGYRPPCRRRSWQSPARGQDHDEGNAAAILQRQFRRLDRGQP